MIGTLYKFSILQTALTTIGSEVRDAVRRVGSMWHMCVFIWSCIYMMCTNNSSLWMYLGKQNTRLMVTAILYLMFHNYVIAKIEWFRFVRFKMAKFIAKVLVTMTAPIAFLLHMWCPLQTKIACTFQIGLPSLPNFDEEPCYCFQAMTIALAALMTIFLIVRDKNNKRNRLNEKTNSFEATPSEYSGMMTRRRSEMFKYQSPVTRKNSM